MALTTTQQMDVRKRQAVLAALDKLSKGFDQTLQNLIDDKLPSTEVPPIQLELQLDFSQCITPARLLKVSEPCTKVTQSPS